jgi:hypothetical protein
MRKFFASGIAFAAFLTPAIANEYWVVLDPATGQCSVVETSTAEGTGTDESQQAATDTTERAGAANSQATAAATTEETTTDNSQEATTDNTIAESKTDRPTATNNAEAQTITDTKDLLRLLAEAAEPSRTAKKLRAYPTRAEAEYRMSIMRKCGIAR